MLLFTFINVYIHADDDWTQGEIQWWEQQQEIFQQEFEPQKEESKQKNTSEFKLTTKYWEKIRPYFFKNNTYQGYCVLDAYNDPLPLIITKVRSKNTYSIAVDVNVYADDSQNVANLKLCHTDDFLNAYAWTDSQNVRYESSNCIYEMYFKLCSLSQYPKTNIPGILIPLKTSTPQNILTNKLNQQLKDGMKSIWENTDNEFILDEPHKEVVVETSQSSVTDEIKSWQKWFKDSLNAIKKVNFDFKKHVIDPICLDEDLKIIFEQHFGQTMIKQEIEERFNQKLVTLSETVEQLQNRISELQTEKAAETINAEKIIDQQPVYKTKDGRTIGKLKRVNGENVLDSIKQYQDDSKNEKSNLTEENIKQMQEESRKKILTKAQENIESTKRAEAEKAKGIQQFGSTASDMNKEMNQLFTRSNENEEFDPKAALKRIKDKNIPKEEPKKTEYKNEPGKLQLDNKFKQNMESIFGGFNNDSDKKTSKENSKTPGKLKNDLGIERKEPKITTQKEDFSFDIPPAPALNLNEKSFPSAPTPPPLNLNSTTPKQSTQQEFYIPPAPELKLDTKAVKSKEEKNTQPSLEQILKKRQEILNKR